METLLLRKAPAGLPASDVPLTVRISRRFSGPRGSANGGYAAGLFAEPVGGPARVVLRRPIPLGRDLRLVPVGAGGFAYARRSRIVAEVTAAARFELEPPVRPTTDDARDAERRNPSRHRRTPFSHCFVCSPTRADGLGVTPGPLAGRPDVFAAIFRSRNAGTRDGVVAPELVWAALDCPSYPAAAASRGEICVLGTIEASRSRDIEHGERLVAVGWTLSVGTRSFTTASVLLGPDGVVASARTVWVTLRRQPR